MDNSAEARIRELANICAEMNFRLERVEAALGVDAEPAKPRSNVPSSAKAAMTATPIPRIDAGPPRTAQPKRGAGEAFNWLGFTGVGCFILAAVYLIRLSIETAWLTPERQVLLSAVFGILLIACGELNVVRDRRYGSLLAGAGAVILHLTVYGAYFVHSLLAA